MTSFSGGNIRNAMMVRRKTIGKRRELCMDTSVSYIAKPRGAIAFVIKMAVVFLQMASPLPIR